MAIFLFSLSRALRGRQRYKRDYYKMEFLIFFFFLLLLYIHVQDVTFKCINQILVLDLLTRSAGCSTFFFYTKGTFSVDIILFFRSRSVGQTPFFFLLLDTCSTLHKKTSIYICFVWFPFFSPWSFKKATCTNGLFPSLHRHDDMRDLFFFFFSKYQNTFTSIHLNNCR